MKTSILFVAVGLTAVLFTACSGERVKSNPILGDFVKMEITYNNEIRSNEERVQNAQKMDDLIKYGNRIEQLEKEKKEKMDEYIATNPFPDTLPLQRLYDDERYHIDHVSISYASAGVLNIEFYITILEEMRDKPMFPIYFKAVDKNGEDIPNSKTVAVSFQRVTMDKDAIYKPGGGWRKNAIEEMENFAKVVQISEEEYEMK